MKHALGIGFVLLALSCAAQKPETRGGDDSGIIDFFEPYLGPNQERGQGTGAGGRHDLSQDPSGPYYHRILLAASQDGKHWKLSTVSLMERASVPELFEGPDGRAILLYVNGNGGGLAALVEQADGTWKPAETDLAGVDPNVVRLQDGAYVAYMKAGMQGTVDAYTSNDGLHWQHLGEVFNEPNYPMATDPDVFQTKDGWVMLISLGPRLLRCTSSDGLHFKPDREIDLGGSVCDTVAVSGGWRTFFHVNGDPRTGGKMHIGSAFTRDGVEWKIEKGARVEAPSKGPAALGVGDPAALQRRDGTWLMAVKSFMPNQGQGSRGQGQGTRGKGQGQRGPRPQQPHSAAGE